MKEELRVQQGKLQKIYTMYFRVGESAQTMFVHILTVPTREGATTTRQLSSGPNLEPTEVSGDDSAVRQRVLVGDPLNDKQWSDDLSDPS